MTLGPLPFLQISVQRSGFAQGLPEFALCFPFQSFLYLRPLVRLTLPTLIHSFTHPIYLPGSQGLHIHSLASFQPPRAGGLTRGSPAGLQPDLQGENCKRSVIYFYSAPGYGPSPSSLCLVPWVQLTIPKTTGYGEPWRMEEKV